MWCEEREKEGRRWSGWTHIARNGFRPPPHSNPNQHIPRPRIPTLTFTLKPSPDPSTGPAQIPPLALSHWMLILLLMRSTSTHAIKWLSGACSSNMHANPRGGNMHLQQLLQPSQMIIMLHVELAETFPEYSLIHLQLWPERQFLTCTGEPPDSSINSMMKGHNSLLLFFFPTGVEMYAVFCLLPSQIGSELRTQWAAARRYTH